MIGDPGHHGEVMGDEQKRHPLGPHEVAQQVEDLRLRGYIQRRGRLVRDQQVGGFGNRQRNGDALALPAREFMRIEAKRKARFGQADAVQPVAGAGERLILRQVVMDAQHLGHLIADIHQRVQRRHRLLKDHADAVAANPAQLILGQIQQVLFVQQHLSPRLRAMRQQAHDRQRRHRLARAALADQPGDPPGFQLQVNVAQNGAAMDGDGQVPRLDHACITFSRGSSASRSPSPKRFSPSTVRKMQRPGMTATWGARVTKVCASASIRPQLGVGGCAPRPT